MDHGDRLADADRIVLRQVVHEADDERDPALGEERRAGRHSLIAPDHVGRELRVEGVRPRLLVEEEEPGTGRHHPGPVDVKGRRAVHVHAVGRISLRRKGFYRLHDGRNRELDKERRGARARRHVPVGQEAATWQERHAADTHPQFHEISSCESHAVLVGLRKREAVAGELTVSADYLSSHYAPSLRYFMTPTRVSMEAV